MSLLIGLPTPTCNIYHFLDQEQKGKHPADVAHRSSLIPHSSPNPCCLPSSTNSTMLSAGKLLAFLVFLFLDLLDAVLCVVFRFVDGVLEGGGGGGPASQCYCSGESRGDELSESLYRRKNVFRKLVGKFARESGEVVGEKLGKMVERRWSDCGCESCLSWLRNGDDLKLHVVTFQPSNVHDHDEKSVEVENVIFLHGFIASSSFWTETVVPNLSKKVKKNYRLFAVDLLGFGRSPKPRDCLYTLRDHLEMVKKSVVESYDLDSFHVVSHSMGCVIGLALAAEYADSVKSVTLVAPPYFPSEENACVTALGKLAEKKLWPPLAFGSAVMSWYEHVGRCVCFFICRYHLAWESVLKLLSRKRNLHFMIVDLTRHTHHSGWHTMHNVLCGGVKFMDDYLTTLNNSAVKLKVIQGDKDQVVPMECLLNIKKKFPAAEIRILKNADHSTVILGREKQFAQELESFWDSTRVTDTTY
ncbi:unnamed protein product [Rhodiola kirilowii]